MTTPLWCIGVAWILIFVPRPIVAAGQARQPEGYDNRDPRDQQARLSGAPRRALAAHQNALEGFPPFAAAVLVAHLTGANPTIAAALAITYCASRVLYTAFYITGQGTLRSLVWGVGATATAALFLVGAL